MVIAWTRHNVKDALKVSVRSLRWLEQQSMQLKLNPTLTITLIAIATEIFGEITLYWLDACSRWPLWRHLPSLNSLGFCRHTRTGCCRISDVNKLTVTDESVQWRRRAEEHRTTWSCVNELNECMTMCNKQSGQLSVVPSRAFQLYSPSFQLFRNLCKFPHQCSDRTKTSVSAYNSGKW